MRGDHFNVNQIKEENLYILLRYQLFNTAYRLIDPKWVRPLVDKRWYNQVSTGNPY
jgi:hypothetical protein